MCRHFDLDLAEVCHHEKIGLLSFSPLACGILSGKYLNNKVPVNSRKSIYKDLGNRVNGKASNAAYEYLKVANKHNIDPCQMALSFCLHNPLMTSVIFGSTNENQLLNSINSINVNFTNELRSTINNVYRRHPLPF